MTKSFSKLEVEEIVGGFSAHQRKEAKLSGPLRKRWFVCVLFLQQQVPDVGATEIENGTGMPSRGGLDDGGRLSSYPPLRRLLGC